MDYKIFWKTLILILGFSFFQTGCSEKDDQKEQVTYYVEIGNCMDSLKNKLDAGINGKVSYYQNNQLNVLSLNYVTGQFPDMHYFKSIQELRSPIPEGTKKIRVEFAGNLTNDSTLYSIQRFKFTNKAWFKTSDMGFIRAETHILSAKNTDTFNFRELTGQVIQNIAGSTY